MKKQITHLTIALLVVAVISGLDLAAQSATDIIRASETAIRGRSQVSRIRITITTRRWTRTLDLSSWEDRGDKVSFSEITDPVKDRGNRFLLRDRTMWHFVPNLKRVIKISPSMMLQAWMGSDFTNDDIVKESSILEDYTHVLDGEATVDGHPCYRIMLKPKPDAAVVWGKIIYYARTADSLPVKEEFYNEHNVLKKVLECTRFRKVHDRVIPTRYTMQTAGKPDRFTTMEILDARFDIPIPASVFSLQNLQRR